MATQCLANNKWPPAALCGAGKRHRERNGRDRMLFNKAKSVRCAPVRLASTPPGLGRGRSWRTGEQPRHPFEEIVRGTDTRRARAIRPKQGDAVPSDLAKRHHASDAPLNDFLPHGKALAGHPRPTVACDSSVRPAARTNQLLPQGEQKAPLRLETHRGCCRSTARRSSSFQRHVLVG